MSFKEPGIPKKKCQNRQERSAMASKTTVAPSSLPLNIPFQEEGQFFHFQCMQSIEPKHPGHPLLEDSVSSCSRSSTAGRLKASLPYILSIALQKRRRFSSPVFSAIRYLSSCISAAMPVANICIAAAAFCVVEKPSSLQASRFCLK